MNSTTDANEEDPESSSSSFSNNQDANKNELLEFRETWKKEIITSQRRKSIVEEKNNSENEEENDPFSLEAKAKRCFLLGAEMERSCKFYEAIQYYKEALQLVPDIELKLHEETKKQQHDLNKEITEKNSNVADLKSNKADENNSEIGADLYMHIQNKVTSDMYVCYPKFDQSKTHICNLPMEIIFYILKWVVSADLDMRSLEMCSQVSRGLFLCCRDPEIWHLACKRVWGSNCGSLTNMYPTWRQMYIERPRLNFSGCYIGKTVYIRPGERSFQDEFYRSWHQVIYYRYFRFFPDGIVLTMTGTDEPAQSVGQLKNRNINKGSGILNGHYRLKDDKILIVIRHKIPQVNMGRKGRRDQYIPSDRISEQTSKIELQIKNYKKKRNNVQLVWNEYVLHSRKMNGTESNNPINLNTHFPPLWFSRVRSYTSKSESILM